MGISVSPRRVRTVPAHGTHALRKPDQQKNRSALYPKRAFVETRFAPMAETGMTDLEKQCMQAPFDREVQHHLKCRVFERQ
jgi:hypothetical protein